MSNNYRIKALLVGPSKSGKSTSAATIPGSKLVIETDKRESVWEGTPDTDIILIHQSQTKRDKPWESMKSLLNEIWDAVNANSFGYDALIFDGLSSEKRITMDWCLNLSGNKSEQLSKMPGGGPSRAHYGPHIFETDQFINKALALPLHIVFTGHFYTFEDEVTKKIEVWPNVFGNGLRNEIGSWFDETYATSYNRITKSYQWITSADSKLTFLGSTLNRRGKYWESPITIDFSEDKVGFEKLLDLRFNKGEIKDESKEAVLPKVSRKAV